jgi:hypothetical protein
VRTAFEKRHAVISARNEKYSRRMYEAFILKYSKGRAKEKRVNSQTDQFVVSRLQSVRLKGRQSLYVAHELKRAGTKSKALARLGIVQRLLQTAQIPTWRVQLEFSTDNLAHRSSSVPAPICKDFGT